MADQNINPIIHNKLLSEESEDYTLDDIVQLHKIEDSETASAMGTFNSKGFKPGRSADLSVSIEDDVFDLGEVKDIETVLKKITYILGTKVSVNINKFANMTENELSLRGLYNKLEELSRNRGNAKEIIEIGSKIDGVEKEKQSQFISDDEIEHTIQDILLIMSVLDKFQYILRHKKA